MNASKVDELLLERFVASFDKLNDMLAIEDLNPIAWELSSGEPNQYGCKSWRPAKVRTERSVLDSIYAKLPAQFPPLYELMVLSYRWAEVDLGLFRLMQNPPGPGLDALWVRDRILTGFLLPRGYIQFGKGPDCDYDPVCFDISSRRKNRDYKIVKIDHEEILCYDRLKIVAEMAPSFQELVNTVIQRADAKRG